MPDIFEGNMLLIEDTEKDIASVERSFPFFKVNRVFDKMRRVIVGKHERFDDGGSGQIHYEVLMEIARQVGIPILAEFGCCYTKPMLTMPIGRKIQLDTEKKDVLFL